MLNPFKVSQLGPRVLTMLNICVGIGLLWLSGVRSVILWFVPISLRYKKISQDIVLITGAGSGIGRLMAVEFAKRGAAALVLWDVNTAGNEETARLVRALGGKAFTYTVDVSSSEQVYLTSDRVVQHVGNVTILINNAGIVSGKSLLELKDEQIINTMNVNVISHFWTIKAFLPEMMASNRGHIVTIASAAGLVGTSLLTDYCSSKFAAVGLAESLRVELLTAGKFGVYTTCVCPSLIDTGLFAGAKFRFSRALVPEYLAKRVVEAVLTNEQFIVLPADARIGTMIKDLLPTEAQYYVMKILKADQFMDSFTGKRNAVRK